MSSPKKRSIREARLEKIEKLLEEHENSMFSLLHDASCVSCRKFADLCSWSFLSVALCTLLCRMRNKLEQRIKCKIVSLTLKQSEQSRKNQKADSKNTNQYAQYVVQVAFYNCETTRNRVFIKELICILCYNLILKEIFYWLFIKTPRLRLKQMIDCMHLMSVFLRERYSCRQTKRMRKME